MKHSFQNYLTKWKEKVKDLMKTYNSDNWLEGAKLNLFGGTFQETVNYLKSKQTK